MAVQGLDRRRPSLRGGIAALRQLLPSGRSLPDEAWRARHRALLGVLWLHVVGIPAFGLTQGYPLHHVAVDALALILLATLASLSTAAGWRRKASSACVALGLLMSSAVFVHFWHGTIEGHFHFFVMIALLLLYEEWLPFLVAIGYVLIHHGLMGQVDPASVYDHPDAVAHPWKWAAIHAAFVAAAAAANIAAWRLNENVRSSLHRAQLQVEERERQFRSLVANLPAAVYRRAAHGQQTVAFLSDRVARIAGYPASDFVGEGARSLAGLVHPDDVDKAEDAIARAVEASSAYVLEYRLLHADGKRLEGTVREADTVARLGGDEFGMLLDGCDRELVGQLVERVHAALGPHFVLHGVPLAVEASVGVALYPEHGDEVDILLQRADIAMYNAKAARSSSSTYDPAADDYNPRRLALVADLRAAIDRRELVLHYQPKAKLRTCEVGSLEALVRWQHPDYGLVMPDEFIPLAQETGLIKPLTLYVIDEALRQCRAWQDEGRRLGVAVNLSTRNLIDVGFPADVAALLEERGFQADLLELEAEIWEALRLLRCDEAQGYFLTKPLPADELTRWLDDPNRVQLVRQDVDDFPHARSA